MTQDLKRLNAHLVLGGWTEFVAWNNSQHYQGRQKYDPKKKMKSKKEGREEGGSVRGREVFVL